MLVNRISRTDVHGFSGGFPLSAGRKQTEGRSRRNRHHLVRGTMKRVRPELEMQDPFVIPEDPQRFGETFVNCCRGAELSTLESMLAHPSMDTMIVNEQFILRVFSSACASARQDVIELLLSHPKYGSTFNGRVSLISWALVTFPNTTPQPSLSILSHPQMNFVTSRLSLIFCAMNTGNIPVVGEPLDIWKVICRFLCVLQLQILLPQHAEYQNTYISIKVVSPVCTQTSPSLSTFDFQDGHEVYFKMRRMTALQKLKNAYAQRQAIDVVALRFLYNGLLIPDSATPQTLIMDEGDIIDCVLMGD